MLYNIKCYIENADANSTEKSTNINNYADKILLNTKPFSLSNKEEKNVMLEKSLSAFYGLKVKIKK